MGKLFDMTTSTEEEQPEQQPPLQQPLPQQQRYIVTFEGCYHTRHDLTMEDLLKPPRRDPVTRQGLHLCWSCMREERGKCDKSPYHRVAGVTALPPSSP
jgi:hypothetical protein